MRTRALLGRTTPVVVLAAALVVTGPRPPAHPAQVGPWLIDATPDLALVHLAAVGAWCCLGWLLLAVVVSALAAAPGSTGRVASAVGRRVVPAALRGALGLSLTALPVAASWPAAVWAEDQPPTATWSPPSLDRPASTPLARHSALIAQRPAPPARYVVQPGDCLWSIARDHMRGRPDNDAIARAWPSWYAANRRVVGADADLIAPGQQLTIPPRANEVSP
jgi:nucleoid-associated protein YgaU